MIRGSDDVVDQFSSATGQVDHIHRFPGLPLLAHQADRRAAQGFQGLLHLVAVVHQVTAGPEAAGAQNFLDDLERHLLAVIPFEYRSDTFLGGVDPAFDAATLGIDVHAIVIQDEIHGVGADIANARAQEGMAGIDVTLPSQRLGIQRPVGLRHDHHLSDIGDHFGGIRLDEVLPDERGFQFSGIMHMVRR